MPPPPPPPPPPLLLRLRLRETLLRRLVDISGAVLPLFLISLFFSGLICGFQFQLADSIRAELNRNRMEEEEEDHCGTKSTAIR